VPTAKVDLKMPFKKQQGLDLSVLIVVLGELAVFGLNSQVSNMCFGSQVGSIAHRAQRHEAYGSHRSGQVEEPPQGALPGGDPLGRARFPLPPPADAARGLGAGIRSGEGGTEGGASLPDHGPEGPRVHRLRARGGTRKDFAEGELRVSQGGGSSGQK